jgi:hypothetical protein
MEKEKILFSINSIVKNLKKGKIDKNKAMCSLNSLYTQKNQLTNNKRLIKNEIYNTKRLISKW